MVCASGNGIVLRQNHLREETLEAIRELWPGISSSKAPIVLLNGVWSAVPELQADIMHLAAKKHVIVADEMVPLTSESMAGFVQPRHWIEVSSSRANSSLWAVTIARK